MTKENPMISASVAKKIIRLIDKYKEDVPSPALGNWEGKSDGELWAHVLVQIAVVGSAASGRALNAILLNKEDWYERLVSSSTTARAKAIHSRFCEVGVRYASTVLSDCRKTAAAAYNFEVLESYGGPRSYFGKIAAVPLERWRVAVVGDDLAYIKNKGARDLLICLGLAHQVIAFDIRLVNVLRHLGVQLPTDLATNKLKYKALESELLAKVCQPCGVTGAHFDRILFNRYDKIIV
jgi:hypothetical protein